MGDLGRFLNAKGGQTSRSAEKAYNTRNNRVWGCSSPKEKKGGGKWKTSPREAGGQQNLILEIDSLRKKCRGEEVRRGGSKGQCVL